METEPLLEMPKKLPTPWRHLFSITGSGLDDKLFVKVTPNVTLEATILEMGIDKILFLWGGCEYLADYKLTSSNEIRIPKHEQHKRA